MRRVSKHRMRQRANEISETDVYDKVYSYYEWTCILTWKKLERGHVYMYPHLFPKWAYTKLRLVERNIVLVASTILHEQTDVLFTKMRNDIWKHELMNMIKRWVDLAPMIKEYYNKEY